MESRRAPRPSVPSTVRELQPRLIPPSPLIQRIAYSSGIAYRASEGRSRCSSTLLSAWAWVWDAVADAGQHEGRLSTLEARSIDGSTNTHFQIPTYIHTHPTRTPPNPFQRFLEQTTPSPPKSHFRKLGKSPPFSSLQPLNPTLDTLVRPIARRPSSGSRSLRIDHKVCEPGTKTSRYQNIKTSTNELLIFLQSCGDGACCAHHTVIRVRGTP